jgi:hypothetical protein
MDEQLTHGDVMEIIEALREHGKRLRRLAARRDATGPRNAQYRAGLRARAQRAERAADVVVRRGPEIFGRRS